MIAILFCLASQAAPCTEETAWRVEYTSAPRNCEVKDIGMIDRWHPVKTKDGIIIVTAICK